MSVLANRIWCFLILGINAIWPGHLAHAGGDITLPGENFFPEGIASDGNGGIFVGSLITRQILHIDLETHKATVFADANSTEGLLSLTGLLVDQKHELLYACSTDAGLAEFEGHKITSLYVFDLRGLTPSTHYPLPGGGFCNDMAMGPDGSLYVTDTYNPRILVLRPKAAELEVWVENEIFGGEGINLNGIVWSGDQLYVVKSNNGALFRITEDQEKPGVVVLQIETPRPLQFPDGLEFLSKGKLLVVEGAGNLTEIQINGDVAKLQVISQGLDVPTTMEIIDGQAIVVQAQLDHLFDPDKAGKPSPFILKVIPLK